MDATAIVFCDLDRSSLWQSGSLIGGKRSMASVPFGCRYRLIDFSLSSLSNAGIRRIGLVSSFGDRELMDHVGSGKDWDLAIRSGGIRFLPTENGASHFLPTRLTLLKGIRYAISMDSEPYVIVCDGDLVCNPDVSDMLSQHRRTGAQITMGVKKMMLSRHTSTQRSQIICRCDDEGNVLELYPQTEQTRGEHMVCMHYMVMHRSVLLHLIDESITHHLMGLYRQALVKAIGKYKIMAYQYDGYYAKIRSIGEYFACSMLLAKDSKIRKELFDAPKRPILTRIRNSPPSFYRSDATIRSSLVADGCEINGDVENSILFRGVKIPKGAVVRSSILLRGCQIGEGASINCVIADQGASIHSVLSGVESLPFYVGEGIRL